MPPPPGSGYSPVSQNLKGAALAQETAKKFGGLWKLLFFSCATCTLAAGVISILVSLTGVLVAPFDLINYVFLTLFGLIMIIVDFPVDNPAIRNFKYSLWHYALFMTRFLGRGFWYIFLSAMQFGTLFGNDLCPFLGFIMGGWTIAVAIYSIIYGAKLSMKVEGVRRKIREQGRDQWGAYIPPNGMSKQQFRDLAASLKNIVFTEEEMTYIVAAFSFEVRSDDIISRDEFEDWINAPGMMIL